MSGTSRRAREIRRAPVSLLHLDTCPRHGAVAKLGQSAEGAGHVLGIDAAEKVVIRKQLRRSQVLAFFKALPPCLVGMEACATAHYWARELTKLGHRVRLMPAKDVKAYVKMGRADPPSDSSRLDHHAHRARIVDSCTQA